MPPQTPGTRQTLIYNYDSLYLNETTPGNYTNQVYYENSSNLLDSIRVDFTGQVNIDTGNAAIVTIQVINEDNNTVIGTFIYQTPAEINQSYQLGFNVRGVYRYIVYFTIGMEINNVLTGSQNLSLKDIRVFDIY